MLNIGEELIVISLSVGFSYCVESSICIYIHNTYIRTDIHTYIHMYIHT